MDDFALPPSDSAPDGLDDRQIADRLVYLGFVKQDADVLQSLRPWAERNVDDFLQQFYDHQFSHREFVELMEAAGSNRQRLVETQRAYFLDLFQGMPDARYGRSRQRIGQVHARLGDEHDVLVMLCGQNREAEANMFEFTRQLVPSETQDHDQTISIIRQLPRPLVLVFGKKAFMERPMRLQLVEEMMACAYFRLRGVN